MAQKSDKPDRTEARPESIGTYYTPAHILEAIQPACGTGDFLVRLHRRNFRAPTAQGKPPNG